MKNRTFAPMNVFFFLHRTIAKLLRQPRSRGFGVQSPWAYRFVREVLMAKEGTLRHLPLQQRVEARCRRILQLPGSSSCTAAENILTEAEAGDVVWVTDIHRSKQCRDLWHRITTDRRTAVCFDCFDFGLAFFDLKMHPRVYRTNYHGNPA